MKSLVGKVLLGTAFLTCPCHLPIYLALLGGTALGSYLSRNQGLALGFLTAWFLLALMTGWRMVKARAGE